MHGWAHDPRIVTNITSEENKCIRLDRRSDETTHVPDSMTRAVQKIERPVAKVIKGLELPDL